MPMWKKTAARALICVVLVSIGFALGRASMRPTQASAQKFGPAAQVVVYYLHGAIRCVTCNKIEALARDVVQTAFATQLRDGRIVWQVVNYQEREDLAARYDVSSSSVVVLGVRNGVEREFERLDEVWQVVDDPLKFRACVIAAIKRKLRGEGA